MRRVLIDLAVFCVLVAGNLVLQITSNRSALIGFGLLMVVGFARGFTQNRLFGKGGYIFGSIEWLLIVFAVYTTSCWTGVILHPYDNFETVFGFGLLLVLLPAIALSLISYWIGFVLSIRSQVP
jgi:hypothetical protein